MHMAKRVLIWLFHELREMLFPTLFFFVNFNLLVFTVAILSDHHELSTISHVSASIGALLVGKAFLLVDKLSIMDRYEGRPLVYGALWSAFIYYVMTSTLHLAERLIAAATGSSGFLTSATAEIDGIDWVTFFVIQLWVAILLIIFATGKAVIEAIGKDNAIEMIFLNSTSNDSEVNNVHS